MNDNQLNEIIEKIKDSKESNYRIAQETGITEATIGNYKNGKTKPTKANLKLLLKYFSNKNKVPQVILGDNNYMSGGKMNLINQIDDLKKQIKEYKKRINEKDVIIKQLIAQQEKLINKL